ncbi:sugar ABC transporter ATP-binding protein [Betaproteobacteria bacterium]|nr:sugar ABC transporter ATP-binding protein [Betaproteobacteria bacterium]GHT93738.1 sugar ABC transporter ATP-binding protein [Betaproteobacteria bacterium]GHU08499.1 sugar ABC transporter ATP-binding protein [Betaproteobacteria bacterium]GHU16027.1 sugar ABC transporter ATP-binding protein [Betaproteobacteria bacterium]
MNSASANLVADAPALRAVGLVKRYGSHVALKGVNLTIAPGSVHILFGENGAGKSTLISMLAGANVPSEGHIETGGHRGAFASVAEARAHGVRAVFQEFSLVPHLTVAENISLGDEPLAGFGLLAKTLAYTRAQRLITELGFDIDAAARIEDLARGKQQMVEICKAVAQAPRVLILDEPTASLSEHDAQALFALMNRLKAAGTAIIYITHRMHEIPLVGDMVTVLRDGQQIATVPTSTPESELVALMTGRTVSNIYPEPRSEPPGPLRLRLEHLYTADGTVMDASLQLRAGEIVGIAGLVGCGKSELGQACYGLRRISRGTFEFDDQPRRFGHPADAIAAGVWYSPPDRKRDGLAMMRPASENMTLSALLFGADRGKRLRPKGEAATVARLCEQVDFSLARSVESVSNFSGGNQQKVLLAKGLAQEVGVYIFDEPTVGVDVGARQSIYQYLARLSNSGAAILLISSDLPELMGMSHRMLVMRNGRMVAEFAREAFDEQQILEYFFE